VPKLIHLAKIKITTKTGVDFCEPFYLLELEIIEKFGNSLFPEGYLNIISYLNIIFET
jgi:hypothetical protein